MNKKIMVIAAHPDDEILGCGGTIKKFLLKRIKDELQIPIKIVSVGPDRKQTIFR